MEKIICKLCDQAAGFVEYYQNDRGVYICEYCIPFDKVREKMNAYVTPDGTYGVGVMCFNQEDLTGTQWLLLDSIADNDKYQYVKACLTENTDYQYALLTRNGLLHG